METAAEGLSALVGLSGVVPARARFVAKYLAVTTYSSLSAGLFVGQIGAMLSMGPLLPYMVGSWFGYTVGSLMFWHQSKQKALDVARKYPEILVHTMCTEFRVDRPGSEEKVEDWVTRGGVGRTTWAILAAQQCEHHVQELQKGELEKIIQNRYKPQ
jgi:hypothetical protein